MNCQDLEDAHEIDDAIICILLRRGASPGVLKIVEGTAAEAVKSFGTRIRNPGEKTINANELAKIVLKANLEAMKELKSEYERQTPTVLVWLAKLLCFQKWQAFEEFKLIVEGL